MTEPSVDQVTTEKTTGDLQDESLSHDIFPFAEGIPFTTLIYCDERIDALVSEFLGAQPNGICLVGDNLACVTQQSGAGVDKGAEEFFALLSE